MDVKVLRYFVEVARQKSFTLAAQKLFVTQPTLSRQIADLEEELGQVLIARDTRNLELTDKGLYFYRQAQMILDLIEKTKLETMCSGEVAGDLTIVAGETLAMGVVGKAAHRFQQMHPKVRIHLQSAKTQDAVVSMRTGLSDFAVFNMPADIQGFDYLRLPDQNRWGILTRRDGPLTGKTEVKPEDIQDLPLIVPQQTRVRERLSGWLNAPVDALNVIGSYGLLYNASFLVREGSHALCIDGIVRSDDEIVFLPLNPLMQTEVVFAWLSGAPRRLVTECFMDVLKEEISRVEAARGEL